MLFDFSEIEEEKERFFADARTETGRRWGPGRRNFGSRIQPAENLNNAAALSLRLYSIFFILKKWMCDDDK
jgi:hypothetical protein